MIGEFGRRKPLSLLESKAGHLMLLNMSDRREREREREGIQVLDDSSDTLGFGKSYPILLCAHIDYQVLKI